MEIASETHWMLFVWKLQESGCIEIVHPGCLESYAKY